jgi:enamine deaminase RidA (YjgF/YER057c/UK114 family)
VSEHLIVNPPELGEPVGFAHAVVAARGRTVWLGGQVGGGESVIEQFDAAATNLLAALAAADGEPDHLVSLTIYTTVMDEYRASTQEIGDVWRRHFGRRYPAMALIGVAELYDSKARVELMGVAVIPDE